MVSLRSRAAVAKLIYVMSKGDPLPARREVTASERVLRNNNPDLGRAAEHACGRCVIPLWEPTEAREVDRQWTPRWLHL